MAPAKLTSDCRCAIIRPRFMQVLVIAYDY